MPEEIRSFDELRAYRMAFALQQEIFEASRKWPSEERFSLTDQVRRSSRSIGANLAEAWAKRRYPAHFVSKLTDADGELQETSHWLASAKACGYVGSDQAASFEARSREIGGSLGRMMTMPEKFMPKAKSANSPTRD